MSRPAPTTPASASSTPAIDLRGVSKRFGRRGRGVIALERADLVVEPGEFVSLVGPSGCGKSTLLRVVGGLLDADAGTVTVVGDSPAQARRDKRFGLVPQEPALLPWRTVRQNVRLLTEVNRKAAGRALGADDTVGLLTEVGLSDFLDAYPQELSGGMQQRVSLVRAFALGAPILLMDEPFAALDEMTREDMRFLLLRLWERSATTIVFVTHHIPEAVVLSDRVLVMSHRPGRIVADERVDLPRPRTTALDETIEFVEHVKRVRRALQQGAAS